MTAVMIRDTVIQILEYGLKFSFDYQTECWLNLVILDAAGRSTGTGIDSDRTNSRILETTFVISISLSTFNGNGQPVNCDVVLV